MTDDYGLEELRLERKAGFRNASNNLFTDISSENFRQYSCGLTIEQPLYLSVSKSGGHRVYNMWDMCYYVQPKEGWWVKWSPIEGEPHFVK